MSIDRVEESTRKDRQSGDRVVVEVKAILRAGAKRKTVNLKDLTTHSAQVNGVGRADLSGTIKICLPGLKPKLAFVAWLDAQGATLEFEKPLCKDVFRELVIRHSRRD